jgi:hypothetical protein
MRNPGPCYKQWTGLSNNAMGPASWYKPAADAGDAMTCRFSGGDLKLGRGARRDCVEISIYLRKAPIETMARTRCVGSPGVKGESLSGLKRYTNDPGSPPKGGAASDSQSRCRHQNDNEAGPIRGMHRPVQASAVVPQGQRRTQARESLPGRAGVNRNIAEAQ